MLRKALGYTVSVVIAAAPDAGFPLFHAWDPEGLPSYDQLMFSGTIGLRFYLK